MLYHRFLGKSGSAAEKYGKLWPCCGGQRCGFRPCGGRQMLAGCRRSFKLSW